MTLAALAALAALLTADPLTTRIGEANNAAEALQGSLDGVWALRDSVGRIIYVFQMSDPPGSTRSAQGACLDGGGGISHADFALIGRREMRVRIADDASMATFTEAGGVWRGRLPGRGAVALTRGLAAPRPPV